MAETYLLDSDNLDTLKTLIEDEITAITTDTTEENLLLLSIAVKNLLDDRTISYEQISDLPSASIFDTGTIVYCEELGIPLVSISNNWYSIDGRRYVNEGYTSYAWGDGVNLAVPDGTADRSSPVIMVINPGWVDLQGYSAILATDGVTTYCWGEGSNGQLGNGSAADRPQSSSATVIGNVAFKKVYNASFHSAGLTQDGEVYCWGNNSQGQLGVGSTGTNTSSPVSVVGNINNFIEVSIFSNSNVALTSDGSLYSWGDGNNGQTGLNTTADRNSPTLITKNNGGWASISGNIGNSLHCFGITFAGEAYAWGYNNNGQLGDGTRTSRRTPHPVAGGITNWKNLQAGVGHSLGITDEGILWAWGSNSSGKLGTNSTVNTSSPVTVVGGITNWVDICAGGGSGSGGVTADGFMYRWGEGQNGVIGDGTIVNKSSPVLVASNINTWVKMIGGFNRVNAFIPN